MADKWLTKRGQVLLAFAFVALTVAVREALRTPETDIPVPGLVHTYLPDAVSVGKWLLAAAIAAYTAFRRTYRWGYYALVFVTLFRTASYSIGTVVWVLSEGGAGDPVGFVHALQYAGFVILLMLLAGPDDGTVTIARYKEERRDDAE